MNSPTAVHDQVKEYYGRVLNGSKDLQTSACCSVETLDPELKQIVSRLDDEILERFYGCGSPIPPALEGATVLDLGCGSGRDAFICSKLVGAEGRVIGLDMTPEQLEVAERHVRPQTEKFGFSTPNVIFRQGYMEDLAAAGVEDDSVDVVISNCVVNLSPDKRRVFSEILRVLKPGGEFYFADVFTDRRLPEAAQKDPMMVGECLGGALYQEDFRRLLGELGVPDYRVVASRRIQLDNPALAKLAGTASFFSTTVRFFKLDSLEDRCEDYGQVATYRGGIDRAPHAFDLDDHHRFVRGKPHLVCGNTAAMLEETRYGSYFRVDGDRSTHYGLFPCGPEPTAAGQDVPGGCC